MKQWLKHSEIAIRKAFIRLLMLRSQQQSPELPLSVGDSPTILLLRQDRLGDAIITTPLLLALKAKYPNAHFIMLLGENNKDIAPLMPFEMEFVIYRKHILEDIEMLRKLRHRKIDVLIDLMDNPSATSSMLTAMIAAKYSVGIQKENASMYNVLVPLLDRAKYHVTRRITELASAFGIDPETINLKPTLKSQNVEQIRGRVGLNISAGAESRCATIETNARIASGIIAEQLANEVIIFSLPKERKKAEAIITLANDNRVMLAPETATFNDFAKQIAQCEILITPDTSALHIASAYGIPVVGLYAPFPSWLHYWTPIGVEYEMIIQEPNLSFLDAEQVIAALKTLRHKITS